MGVLDRKAPQQLAGKTVGIKISIFGNSSWPLTARNGPKRAVLGPFWGIAGRLRLARKFITFFYCRAIKFFLRCLQSPNRRCLPRGGLRSAFPSSNPAFSPEKKCLTSGFYGKVVCYEPMGAIPWGNRRQGPVPSRQPRCRWL